MEIEPNVVYWCKTKEIAEWFVEEYNKNQPISKQITLDIKLYDKYKDFLFVGNKEYFKEKTFYEIVDVEPFYEKECRLKNVEEALKMDKYSKIKKENGTMKLIEIYKANQINKIEKEYEKKCEEIIANDLLDKEVLEIFKETNDKYATALEKYNVKPDGELYLRNKSVEAYTEETGKLFKLAENEKDHAITELQIMFKEVEAQLELCNGDYDKTIAVLKTYRILDENGKVVK